MCLRVNIYLWSYDVLSKIDPFNIWLRKIVLKDFLAAELEDPDREFVSDNVQKHRKVMWFNVLCSIGVTHGLLQLEGESLGMVIAALLAPVMVMGGGWFAISFGGIPGKLMDVAMSITFWMFSAFVISFSAMFIAVSLISPPSIWPALVAIYYGAISACIQYDTADGLKAGLDEAVLDHSRAAIAYYAKQGKDLPKKEAS
jgi:hypothetical protein